MTIAFNPLSGQFDLVTSTPPPPSTGGGFNWITVAGTTETIVAGNGYIAANLGATTFTLPANADTIVGHSFKIIGLGSGFTIDQLANQVMIYGVDQTTSGTGGSISTLDVFTVITGVCVSTSGTVTWIVTSEVGNLTVV